MMKKRHPRNLDPRNRRPESLPYPDPNSNYPETSDEPKVIFNLPDKDMNGALEVMFADGSSLDDFVHEAVVSYIAGRKNSPTFPDELAAARARTDALMQKQLEDPSAPKDIVWNVSTAVL